MPDIFGNLHGLHNFRIHDNNLTGTLPLSLGNITRLQAVLMQNNDFDGCFPYNYTNFCINSQSFPDTEFDFSGNPQLPNGGDFSSFCSNGAGVCDTDLSCDWVQLFIQTGTQPLDLFFGLTSSSGHQAVNSGVSLVCLLYTSPSPRDLSTSRMPSSA